MIVKLILTVTILSVEVTMDEEHNFNYILETKNTFFHKINANVHNTANQIFSCLRLFEYSSKSNESELLLKMHNDFLNIAEKYYIAYEHVRNVSNTNFTMGNYQSKFLESLNEVIKEETNKNKHKRSEPLDNTRNNTESEEIDESLEFLDEFVNKFSKMTLENLTKQEINESSKNIIVKLFIKSKKKELKAWNSTIPNGTPSNQTRRLYNGKETRIYKYPFLVSIHIFNEFVCAGSIISKDLVVTAASCLPEGQPESVFVRVGSDYPKINGQLIPVASVYFYPEYEPETLRNNIAIIRIKKRFKLPANAGRIRRIIYNKKIEEPSDGVYVLGWGTKNPQHSGNENLKKMAVGYLDLFSFWDCQDIYTSHYVSDSNFCAGFIEKGAGACNKDVGGPGFHDGILLGIISFGPPVCGKPNNPTVFTNIGFYATWIDSIVHQNPILQITKPFPSTTRTVQIAKPLRSKYLSNKSIFTTSSTADHPPDVSVAYSEEVNVVKDMLQEIVLTNSSVADYILYGNTIAQVETEDQQEYNKNSNNNDNLRINSRTTDMYNDMIDKHDTSTYQVNIVDLTTKEHKPIFKESRSRDDSNHDLNQEVHQIIDTYTPVDHINNVNNALRMTYDNNDVSENYEVNSDHEHGIAIDTNDSGLKNISFLDVVYNIQQYQHQQSQYQKEQTDDKNDKDTISLKLYLGSESEVDTTRGFLDETPIRTQDEAEVEPETEENSRSYAVDTKNVFREENNNRGHYNDYNVPVDPWPAELAKKLIEKGTMISQQYIINLKRRNLQKPKTYQELTAHPNMTKPKLFL